LAQGKFRNAFLDSFSLARETHGKRRSDESTGLPPSNHQVVQAIDLSFTLRGGCAAHLLAVMMHCVTIRFQRTKERWMITQLPFGRTGHLSTRIIFGAAALSKVTQAEADRTLGLLLQFGINHIDTAASYGDSELRIGPWMRQHRQHFFLASKTGERTYAKAREQLHRSLERLQVDQIDLLQLHYLVDPGEWEVALGPGGALEALLEAREQRLIRFIGVTGHDLAVAVRHQQSLERFDFDSVLLPYSYLMMQNAQYAADFEALMTLCEQRQVAVQTIKSITRRPWEGRHPTHATWYEPLTEQGDIDRAVHWVLGREDVFLNTVGDISVLPKVLDAARRFERRPTDADLQQLVTRAAMSPLFV
jgi:predicted aldo/keto reductase-like oxidoreductase